MVQLTYWLSNSINRTTGSGSKWHRCGRSVKRLLTFRRMLSAAARGVFCRCAIVIQRRKNCRRELRPALSDLVVGRRVLMPADQLASSQDSGRGPNFAAKQLR